MKNKKLIGMVAGVGICSGLLGGGAVVGINNYYQNHVTTSVPMSSNKAGGTKVNENKANLNNQSTKAYQSVQTAVVSVINQQNVADQTQGLAGLYGLDPDQGQSKGSLQTVGEGSGVIYKKDGNTAYIVTNNHVVDGSSALQVILSNGKKVDAKLVGKDAATDLAVLKISSQGITSVAEFGNSNQIKAGQDVLAIGSPMGSEYANTVTKGIVSAPKRTMKTEDSLTQVIQTDAAINSGNSGGPLINEAGQVIGINSMKLSSNGSGGSVEGMGFAIPSNEVVKVVNQLVKHGKIDRPKLGIGMLNVKQIANKDVLGLKDGQDSGVAVLKLDSDGAAAHAGMKKYDVITALNGKKISDISDLKSQLYKHKVGQKVRFTVLRQGKPHMIEMTLSD